MENASKALIIAGGVLASVIILGLLVTVWQNVSTFNSGIDDAKKQEQISSFNKEYETYLKQLLRGADVASVFNKVNNDNEKNPEPNMKIICEIEIREDVKANSIKFLSYGQRYTQDSSEIKNMLSEQETINIEQLKRFKRLFFKCDGIAYDNETRRITKIKFIQIPSDQINWLFWQNYL